METGTCINDNLLTKKTFFSSLASFPEKQESQQIIDFSKLQPDKWIDYLNRNRRDKRNNHSTTLMAIVDSKKRSLKPQITPRTASNWDEIESLRPYSDLIP